MMLTEGQMSDHKGAFLLFPALPRAKELLADKGYDSDWFRAALVAQGTTPCIPPRNNRKVQYHYDKHLYRQRHKIENVFASKLGVDRFVGPRSEVTRRLNAPQYIGSASPIPTF